MMKNKLLATQYWLTFFPAFVILSIALLALLKGNEAGVQPREGLFDLYQRVDARAATPETDRPVLVMIDPESVAEIGPWPWPRTSLADLVMAAKKAGAANIVVTVPVAGPDPLSPEIVGQYWFAQEGSDNEIAAAVRNLPSHDVALGTALTDTPAAISISQFAPNSLEDNLGWRRVDIRDTPWLSRPDGGSTEEYIALPYVAARGTISSVINDQSMASVSALPIDPDGMVRRIPMVWTAFDQALPATALTVPMLLGREVSLLPETGRVKPTGHAIDKVMIGDEELDVDNVGAARLYLPKVTSLVKVPAWRLLSNEPSWGKPLAGKTVFIGEAVSRDAFVETARGPMSVTEVHALMAEDLITPGKNVTRPNWAGYMEAGLALLFGVGAVLAGLFLGAPVAAGVTIMLSALLAIASYFLFTGSGLLVDPLPSVVAMIGGQLAIVAGLFSSMLWRDDAVRGSFHGALPATAMAKLQRNRKSPLLNGVRRQVTVLSVAIRLPKEAQASFVDRPQDYIQFMAHTNDRLRNAILTLGGTVDFAEDGRLLGYWNAPEEQKDHIERACTCALQMIDDMSILTQNLQSAAFAKMARVIDESPNSAFEQGCVEIGLASDVAYCGPVGKATRNRYSVIGPVVRFVGQLRRRSILYGPAIICDETVFKALRHQYALLDLDILRVEDEDQLRPIYGLVGNPFLKASKPFRELADLQRDFVNNWRDGQLDEAGKCLEQLKQMPGKHAAYIELMEKRLIRAKKSSKTGDAQKMLLAETVQL